TFDVLGGEPEEARRGAAAVGRDDVRMIERRGCLGGAPEPIFRSRVSERLARSDLHLHLPILTRVVGEVDSGRGLVLCRQQRLDRGEGAHGLSDYTMQAPHRVAALLWLCWPDVA